MTEEQFNKQRIGWNEYFFKFAMLASKRSTCKRRKVGAVAVRDKRVLATGYNGAPSGLSHCEDVGCLREQQGVPSGQRHELCRGLHAEQNVIIQAAVHGVSLSGSTLYLTHQPCFICAKMIIQAGIRAIFFLEGYPDGQTVGLLKEASVETTMMNIYGGIV